MTEGNAAEVMVLPPELYMRRTAFEFGGDVIRATATQSRIKTYLAECQRLCPAEGGGGLDSYWCRERALYDLYAAQAQDGYNTFLPSRVHSHRMLVNALDRLALRPGYSVIDLACGNGLLGHCLDGRVDRYTGLDISIAALIYARALAGANPGRMAPDCFIQGSCLNAPFATNSTNVCVVFRAMERFDPESQQRVVAEGLRVATDFLCISAPNTQSPLFEAFEAIARLEQQEGATMFSYPQGDGRFPVDFATLASAAGGRVLARGTLDIVPPPRWVLSSDDMAARAFYEKAVRLARKADRGCALEAWAASEAALDEEQKDTFGTLTYAVLAPGAP